MLTLHLKVIFYLLTKNNRNNVRESKLLLEIYMIFINMYKTL